MKSLRGNQNIVILKPDKGNGVVVLDRATYDESILNLITDSSKFNNLNCDPTLSREGKLQRLLRKLKKNGEIDDTTYKDIYPTGSQPARIYGSPKMHKVCEPSSAPPFRPIVSSIGTYNYNLAKFLCTLLDSHIPSDFCARDTFSFVNEITNLRTSNKFMVSFDVENLITNIPLLESIELAVDYILSGNPNIKLSKDNLKELFLVATAQTHFLFKGKYYDQIDGVAMGSPLALVLANLFMGHHERIWLQQYDGPEIYFYRRYVDDTFCLFNNETDALEFFHYINDKHPNITFTMETEVNHKLPFLDVLLDNSNPPSLVTSVFRKSTYTGLLTNFLSFSPFPYKLGLIRTLVDRTFKINNTWTGFHNNIKELANILGKNQFPSSLVNRTVKQYLNKFFASPLHASAITNSNEIRTHYYKLPFVGPFSTYVQRRIRNLTQRYCKNLDIKLLFAPYKIKNLFSAKHAISKLSRSRVVYKFSCAGCGACYVGETN